ncbi:hypothetical protein Ais01nite_07480 [Asanoa ishikariensis]|uniref:TIGR04222 domain-containing protein n=1 Tax=Asanoa ishikariensis TaxID=137265 RepID=A0A1H3TBQ1_9ACTN|nr:hypothetical protein [Asanoa ishikariensis]GIF62713.1 hypothetical protein Ais01nite_07480 [Asanoa ishikariensis]SDZ47702.1 TIGR04222 domain-containing protein [Asanoa ishikariensis]
MYALLALALLAARLLIRWLAPRHPVRSATPPDYPVIAHLVGGRRRVALAAIGAARVAGAIDVLPTGTGFRFDPGPAVSDVERTMARVFGRGWRWPPIRDSIEARMAAQKVAEHADDLGLTGTLRAVPAHGLATLAVAAVAAGLASAAAPWWAFVALVPAYALLVRPTRRDFAGEVVVRSVRTARPDLHPWRQASWTGVTPASAGLAVALYGATALRAIDKEFARRLLDPVPRHQRPWPVAAGGGSGDADGGCGDDGCGDGGE